MKILVTGGLGFIGAPLSLALLHAGHAVRILDNGTRGSLRRLGDRADQFDIVAGDIRDQNDVDKCLAGAEVVFHLACVNGTEFFYQRPK